MYNSNINKIYFLPQVDSEKQLAAIAFNINGDITEYVITDANIVYTLKVQNNEIIEADYTW